MDDSNSAPKEHKSIWSILLVFILPLLIGLIVAAFIPKPVIGIISIRDEIDTKMSLRVIKEIDYARTHPEIKAVVLILDSPGGTINDTESIYLELMKLRETKPVVTMVEGLSASGSFYLSMGSDYIVSNPSARVGNVGVIGTLPSLPLVLEETISSGPYKLFGNPREEYTRFIELIKENFYQVVALGRGERLKLSEAQVLRGELYPASEAVKHGLIDEVAARSHAIEKAAQLAHIAHYELVDITDALAEEKVREASTFFLLDENGVSTGYPREAGIYLLYIPNFGSEIP
ncbi:MAG: S49 family peptidase [Chloroflexi bacterium]|nr:S49 family peptidase [Chloroflexota bacterium]RJR08955.1 MAG: S49 family peptidase [Candidatus Parcubacteria bacterium]